MNKSVFSFHDGTKNRRVDGFHLSTKFLARMDANFVNCLAALQSQELTAREGETPEQAQQREQTNISILANIGQSLAEIISTARDLFDVKPYAWDEATDSESGLTDSQVFGLFTEFMAWSGDLKKNIGGMPSLLPVTVPKPSAKSRKKSK